MKNHHVPALAMRGIIVVAMFVAGGWPQLSRAELGGTVASVENDAAHLKGTLRLTATPTYSLHEIRAATGHVMREYATTDGTVFGVSWAGPTIPDLRQLLGERYFTEFQEAATAHPRYGRGPLLIETPNLVFQQTGHLRDFHGRAYLPRLLPSGATADAIR